MKTITVKEETWKRLMKLKIEKGCNLEEIITDLLQEHDRNI